MNVLKTAFTGTIATGLSLIAIVLGGLMFAYGEGQSTKTLAGIVFGVGMAIGAVKTFRILRRLVNLRPTKIDDAPLCDACHLDWQVCGSELEAHRGYLRLDDDYLRAGERFSVKHSTYAVHAIRIQPLETPQGLSPCVRELEISTYLQLHLAT